MGRNLLDDSDSSSSDGQADGSQNGVQLSINNSYAQKFEHNKKREELQKLEEKYGKSSRKRKRSDDDSASDDSEGSSSDSEEDDDVGELVTEALDSEIAATLNAIRSKDPRVYDGTSTFYSPTDQLNGSSSKATTEKPLYLRDYHRQNLLNGVPEEDDGKKTYREEQNDLKKEIVGAMHAAVDSDEDDEDELLVAKKRERPEPRVELDVENADRDPETFLSNFMASRSWVPTEKAAYQPFESDDEDEERRAEEYEEAYNFRFEDPTKSNEKLRTHARDMAARQSARREDKSTRKKKRDAEKEQRALEKQQRKEEKARLKNLRVDQIAQKVSQIKEAAGLKTSDLRPEDWTRLVDDDFDLEQWETQMQERFGDEYYAAVDAISDEQSSKTKKPKFDDDIDITDVVPDFQEEDDVNLEVSDEGTSTKKNHKVLKEERKKERKRERRIIEQLVDDQLKYELDASLPGSSKTAGFRYRETSPQSFGLTARDILLADDSQLNQFAGLKKLAAFRDPDKKAKDKKHLSKKARLRKWRDETFGDEAGLENIQLIPSNVPADLKEASVDGEIDIRTSGKKKRRKSKKSKSS